MKTTKAEISIDMIVLIIIALALLVIGLIYSGILGEHSSNLFQNVLDYLTGQ